MQTLARDAGTIARDTAELVTLYRAIGDRELAHVNEFGNYGSSPSKAGKYFADTRAGATDFMSSKFNRGRTMTLTRIRVPMDFVERAGFRFTDTGGAGTSIHFGEEFLEELYSVASRIDRVR
jgi:hypothetical protein